MINRKPFVLDYALFWWNIFLATFSAVGAARMLPELFWFSFLKINFKKFFSKKGLSIQILFSIQFVLVHMPKELVDIGGINLQCLRFSLN